MDMQSTGKIISQKRKELNMTQKDLAQILNVSTAAVSKWERGLNYPDLSIMEALAKALRINVSNLLQLESEPSEQIIRNITEISINENKVNNKTIMLKIIAISLSAIFSVMIYLCVINNQIFEKLFFQAIGTGILNLSAFVLGVIALCYGIAAISSKSKYKTYIYLSMVLCAVALHIPTFVSYLILRFEYASTLQDIIGGYFFGSAVLLISTVIINTCAVMIHKK